MSLKHNIDITKKDLSSIKEVPVGTISRRSFIKYCLGSAAVLGLDATVIGKFQKAYAGDDTLPTVIWLEGSSCSGCTISLTNLIGNASDEGPTDIADLLINKVNMAFSKTLMSAAGDLAVSSLRAAQNGDYILVVEGGIPTAFNGMACTLFTENGVDVTMLDAILELAPNASAILCVGSCASSGGVPAADPNPTGIKTVNQLTGLSTINLPGCPAHPDWVAGTIASLLCGVVPPTDSDSRPLAFYGNTVHSKCPRKPLYDSGYFASDFGQEGKCLANLGCNGPTTRADCAVRGWNNGFNYCTQSNANCIGCVEKDFPKSRLIERP
jgi:hydrogenase small subunit